MNLLDENIPLEQRDLLRAWGVPCRAIGQDIAELSIADDNIIVLLHRLKRATLFTRDPHFLKRRLCHPNYCLVLLDIVPDEVALFVRRFLRHTRFDTQSQRMGVVARAHHDGIHFWALGQSKLHNQKWPTG